MKKFFVALHAHHRKQVLEEAEKILTPDGAHGVLVVNNGGHIRCGGEHPDLFEIAIEVKERYPDFLVGINPLDISPIEAMKRTIDTPLDVVWTDNAGIIERQDEGRDKAYLHNDMEIYLPRLKASFYGGVAFKYQPQPKNLKVVAQYAAKRFGQVITSGDQTGSQPALEKIKSIKEMIGDVPLGNASGLSVENARQYLPYLDIFIVATSLLVDTEDPFTYDVKKVKKFRAIIEE